jgi:hypothetical protein
MTIKRYTVDFCGHYGGEFRHFWTLKRAKEHADSRKKGYIYTYIKDNWKGTVSDYRVPMNEPMFFGDCFGIIIGQSEPFIYTDDKVSQ